MARIRVRRPLLALVVLLVAILIGYAVRAATNDHHSTPTPTPTASPSVTAGGPYRSVRLVPAQVLPERA